MLAMSPQWARLSRSKQDLLSAEPRITANENAQTSELTRGDIQLEILT